MSPQRRRRKGTHAPDVERVERCGPTRKRRYRTWHAAEIALAEVGKARPVDYHRRERRVYPCRLCGGWHLTSQPEDRAPRLATGGQKDSPRRTIPESQEQITMSVRAKFTVQEHVVRKYGSNYQTTEVVLRPQYDPTIPEDQSYSKATPSGELRMRVDNPAALEQLAVGTVFYLDFTPAENPVAANGVGTGG